MEDILPDIIKKLEEVIEPESNLNIIEMRMIRDIKLEQDNLHFKIYLPSPQYASKDILYQSIHQKLNQHFNNINIHAHFITKSPLSEAPNAIVPQIKNFIAVGSGKGGVGKSTISANIAISLHKLGYKTGLLDADLYGPSMPTMFGLTQQKPQVKEIQGKHKLIPIDAHGIPMISLGNIIEAEQAVVLRGPRLAAIIKQFFLDTVWPELDYLIIDLPPGTGDIQLTLVQTIPLTGAVIVTTPQELSVADAIKAANMFTMEQIGVPILGIIENMSWFTPPEMPDKKYYIFGKGGGRRLTDMTRSKLLGQIPIIESIRERSDNEKSIFTDDGSSSIFEAITKQLVESVRFRNLTNVPTTMVQVNT
ncbi:MAG: Mrp/NBP35 family ATP-binding protein [Bacteroidota bacterium]|nr:Mrp/NBP35 family ATP-binding protein [Bacteroidota bacterium]